MTLYLIIAGVILLLYMVASYILLKKPELLHRKKTPKFNCIHISHRGGSYERLENTMGAFEHAVNHCQTDMLEIDVQLTADKQVVVAHDSSLLRVTGIDKEISDVNYSSLPLLHEQLDVEFMNGQLSQTVPEGLDRRIPLLRDVFERFPSTPMNIDIKEDNDDLIDAVHSLIVRFNRKNITVWGNASYTVTQKCYNKDPSIPIYFSGPRMAWLALVAWTGLLPFLPIRETCLAIFHPYALRRNTEFHEFSTRNPAYHLGLKLAELLLMRPFIFNHLKKRGLQVYLWVLNDIPGFNKGYELGNGVMTDRPQLLRMHLDLLAGDVQKYDLSFREIDDI